MSLAITAAIVTAIAAPLGAYLVAAKRFSGKIETSDAKELWAESRAIRDWSTGRIKNLNEHVDRLEKRVETLEENNEALASENRKLLRHIAELEEGTRV